MKVLLGMALTISMAIAPMAANSQELPNNIRIIVPGGAGGGTDTVTRLFAGAFKDQTGINTIVTNQTAAGGVVATETLHSSAPDGSTLMVAHAKLHTQEISGSSKLGYRDLTPLGVISDINTVYVARADAPYSTLPELIEYAGQHPGEVVLAAESSGTSQVMANALNEAAGGNLRIVDFGSTAERVPALLGDRAQVTLFPVGTTQQYVESGDVKALAVINRNGDGTAPELPTATAQGVDIHFPLTVTLYGPPGMSDELVAEFAEVIGKVTQDDDFRQSVLALGQSPNSMTPEETQQFLDDEFTTVERLTQ